MNTTNSKIFKVVAISIFAAIVFVSNYISIPIPVAIGDQTRIHLANGICILSGLVLGPVGGGLSAGIGSMLYDFTNPLYISSAGFTLVFKFVLAFLPGLMLHKAKFIKPEFPKIIIGGIAGQIAYIVFYLSKTYIQGILEGSAPQAMIPTIITKAGTSATNAVLAIIISVVLYSALKPIIKKNRLFLYRTASDI